MRSNASLESVLRLLAGLALAAAPPLAAVNTVTIDGLFADWADEFCAPDTVCNDFPNQGDAKGACIASNWVNPGPATLAYLRFDFDETGLGGANTADGCWLVDVNQNGLVDRGLCFSLSGNPLVLNTTQLYTCNDTSAATCAGSVAVASGALCAKNSGLTTERLLACPPDTTDTGVECSVPLNELGWTSGSITLIKGCTFSSAQPNSNSSDCLADAGNGNPFNIDPVGGGNTPIRLQGFTVE